LPFNEMPAFAGMTEGWVDATPQRHNATTSQRHNATTSQRHNVTTTQRHNDATSQRHNDATPQRHNDTTTQRHIAFRFEVFPPHRYNVSCQKS
jgi:hypothetical protein